MGAEKSVSDSASVGARARGPYALKGTTATARALRLLLLVVMALTVMEYLFYSIFHASLLLHSPAYNAIQATQPSVRLLEKTRLKKLSTKVAAQTAKPIKNVNASRNRTVKVNFEKSTINSNVANKNNVTESVDPKQEPVLPFCETPPGLGPISVNKTDLELELVEKKYMEVHWGGRYSPPNCTARHKVAIIVPFRDRKQHLAIFLNHMHPFLMRQQIEYRIFIVEQEGNSEFNRAKLMNVGYAESQKQKAGGWQCFIFHDIDLLPLDLRNVYACPRHPLHMSASIDKQHFQLSYERSFGGVSAMTKRQFEAVNGFSNKYWGWGGEDDDMFYRIKKMGFHVSRHIEYIARYAMLDHKKSPPSPKRYQLLSQTSKMFHKDGLSTLEYEVFQVNHHHLYTHVLVNIDEHS